MLREKTVAQTTLTVMPCMNHNKHIIVSSNINNMNNNILKKYSLSVNNRCQKTNTTERRSTLWHFIILTLKHFFEIIYLIFKKKKSSFISTDVKKKSGNIFLGFVLMYNLVYVL